MDSFSITGFAWRIAFALALVLLTFNPSGFSYFHWLSGNFPSFTPAQVVLGIALLILWIFLWRSMMQAIGMLGIGMSWAIIRRELTGQASVDEIDDNQ